MRPRTAAATPALTADERDALRVLLDAVPAACGEDDSRFIALLEAWHAVAARLGHYPLYRSWGGTLDGPPVAAYKCYGGSWLVGDVERVLAALRAHADGGAVPS